MALYAQAGDAGQAILDGVYEMANGATTPSSSNSPAGTFRGPVGVYQTAIDDDSNPEGFYASAEVFDADPWTGNDEFATGNSGGTFTRNERPLVRKASLYDGFSGVSESEGALTMQTHAAGALSGLSGRQRIQECAQTEADTLGDGVQFDGSPGDDTELYAATAESGIGIAADKFDESDGNRLVRRGSLC